jgi:hypothetical protein
VIVRSGSARASATSSPCTAWLRKTPRAAASPDVIVTRFRARPRYRYERKSASWSSMVMIAKFLTVDISK